jgi:hypothetical protein
MLNFRLTASVKTMDSQRWANGVRGERCQVRLFGVERWKRKVYLTQFTADIVHRQPSRRVAQS